MTNPPPTPTPPTTHPPATTGADAAGMAKLLREARAKADSASAYHAMLTPFNALRIADTLEAQARELAAARASLAACRAARESLRLGMTLMQTHYAADKPGVWVVGSELAPVLDEVFDYLSSADTALADADRAGTGGG